MGCTPELSFDSDTSLFEIPSHFPHMDQSNLIAERVELGRWLFFDTRLSRDGTRSCGICHEPAKAFSDGLVRSLGIENTPLPLNSLPLFNIYWREELTWSNRIADLRTHMLIPLFESEPVEMGMEEELLEDRLKNNERYVSLFSLAFPEQTNAVTTENTIQAIADFTSTIVSGNSAYDKWLLGEESLEPIIEQGMDLFYGQELQCSQCHGGLFFDQPNPETTQVTSRHGYFNTGQYNIDEEGSYPENAQGVIESTGVPEDMGKFRVPTLRNLNYTYPWMHDGTQISLRHIIKAYARGGRLLESGPYQGDGSLNPHKSSLIRGFSISEEEIDALISFLDSLQDESLIHADKWHNPFCVEVDGIIANEPCETPFQVD